MSVSDDLLDSIRRTADMPFDEARTLPREAYTDPEFASLEVDRLFRGNWVCFGRMDEIPDPGDYIAHRIIDTPVVVVRQRDMGLKALVNICRHRGTKLLDGVGHVDRIVCPYHAWCYNLDGRLRTAPFSGEGFDCSKIRLPEVRTDVWEGWIYVTLDSRVAPISDGLASLSSRIAAYHAADQVMVHRDNEVWECNWKTLAENFTESYHLFASHKNSLQLLSPTQGVWCEPGDSGWNIHWMETSQPQDKVWPDTDNDTRRKFPLMHIYPSHVVSIRLGGGFWMSLQPDTPGRVRILWGVTAARPLVPKDPDELAALKAEIKTASDAINLEDHAIVESVAQSLKSAYCVPGRLCPKEYPLWEFWRYIARMLCQHDPEMSGSSRQ